MIRSIKHKPHGGRVRSTVPADLMASSEDPTEFSRVDGKHSGGNEHLIDGALMDQENGSPTTSEREIKRLVEVAGEEGLGDRCPGKRASARFAAGMQLDVSTDPASSDSSWPVTMHNVSDGGFAFWSKRQHREGGEIYVREFSADNSLPWVRAQVTHCTVGIKGYLTGANFSNEPQST